MSDRIPDNIQPPVKQSIQRKHAGVGTKCIAVDDQAGRVIQSTRCEPAQIYIEQGKQYKGENERRHGGAKERQGAKGIIEWLSWLPTCDQTTDDPQGNEKQ